MIVVEKRAQFNRTFAAAHRVWNDLGKCRNIHGHNYEAEIEIATPELNDQNFVVPFEDVKAVIDYFDHTLILDRADELAGAITVLAADDPDGVFASLAVRVVPGVPSTEFMAEHIAAMIGATSGLQAASWFEVTVRLRETPGIMAVGTASKELPW